MEKKMNWMKKSLGGSRHTKPDTPMSLSAFQLWAINQITRTAENHSLVFFQIVLEIVRHESVRCFGHQLKIHFFESDQRIWINGDSFSYEAQDRKSITVERDDFLTEEEFKDQFKAIVWEVVPDLN